MSGDDWPDDSRDREEPDAWRDQPAGGPPPAPPKQGMSTAAKILIVLLCIGGGFFLLCCGGAIYLYSQMDFEFNEDPAIAAQRLAEITDIELPDNFEAEGSMSFDFFFMSMKMVVYKPTAGDGALLIAQINMDVEGAPDAEEEMRRSIRQQGHQKDLKVVRETVETREFEIRGETVEFEFAQAENEEGEKYRQVVGAFPAKEGTALLMLQVEEDQYNEEAVVNMIESIK